MIARCTEYRELFDKLIVDLFAGAGGASTGIEEAFMAAGIRRHVDLAVNHDEDAIACHVLNHPLTEHLRCDVFDVDPATIEGDIGLLWASPDCTDFSKAKGGKPIRTTKRRSLAWAVVHWAFVKRPDVIILENVEEFRQWGPIDDAGQPVRDGSLFERWADSLRALGYAVEHRELRACDYGTPTTRKRLFVVARCDGRPIVWPEPTHKNPAIVNKNRGEANKNGRSRNKKRLRSYRTAAQCIDWSIPMLSIFATPDEAKAWGKAHGIATPRRPLRENTLRRIARGVVRYVLNGRPFIVPMQSERQGQAPRVHDVDEPMPTVAAGGTPAVIDAAVSPLIVGAGGPAYAAKPKRADEPLGTVMVEDRRALVSCLMTNTTGHAGAAVDQPVPTVTTGNHQHLVSALVTKHYGNGVIGHGIDRPLGSVTTVDHHAVTTAYLSYAQQGGSNRPIDNPMHTLTASHKDQNQVVAAILSRASNNGDDRNRPADAPFSVVTCRHDAQLAAASLIKLKGTARDGQSVDVPLSTVQAGGTHSGLVAAFLAKYYGSDVHGQSVADPLHTMPTVERFGLVTVVIDGQTYIVTDIAMRMLTPRELARAQGFRDDYVIDRGADGRPLSKRTQVRLIGNSVCRHVARALVKSNVIEQCDWAGATDREAVMV